MFVLSSPSGAGKTTLTKKLAKNNKNLVVSISYTTRKPRLNEIHGKDYYFVDKEEFDSLIKDKANEVNKNVRLNFNKAKIHLNLKELNLTVLKVALKKILSKK